MKSMTCNQLGGACDHVFSADSFEEIQEMSKQHGMEMFRKEDQPHLEAMQKMRALMVTADSDAMKTWMQEKRAAFDALPNN
jgi:hypothetical protein